MEHNELKRAFAVAVAPSIVDHALKLRTESAIAQIAECVQCKQMRAPVMYGICTSCREKLSNSRGIA